MEVSLRSMSKGGMRMNIGDVVKLLDGVILCGEDLADSLEVKNAYGADLMSDVLAFAKPGSLLITGLTNVQIVRTAQMMDLPAIVFVRGKRPQESTLELAQKVGVPIILVRKSMYETCGILFGAGIIPCEIPDRGV